MSEIAALVLARRNELGLSQTELAKRVGTTQATIDKIENDRSERSRFLPAVFAALGLPMDQIAAEVLRPPLVTAIPAKGSRSKGGDLPVYASAQGGEGEMIISFEPIDYVSRPGVLMNVRDGYAMYVVGDSMSPRYEPGDMALVNPHRAPKSGDDLVLFKQAPVGPTEALVKRLVRATADRWNLTQFNPGKELALSRREWPVCHVIVGRY